MCLARSSSSSAASPALACLTKDGAGKLGCTRRISAARRRTSVGEKESLEVSAHDERLPQEITGGGAPAHERCLRPRPDGENLSLGLRAPPVDAELIHTENP